MNEVGLSFRPPDSMRRARTSFLLWSAIPLMMVLMAFSSGGGLRGATFPLALLAFISWRSWRISQVAVSIYPNCLVVKNVMRTYRIPWGNVKKIGLSLTAPPDDLLRGALGLPPDETSLRAIPEHRRIVDENDGVTKFILAISISTGKKFITADAVTADLVEALAVAWAAAMKSQEMLVPSPASEWEKVISTDELTEWFKQEGPLDKD